MDRPVNCSITSPFGWNEYCDLTTIILVVMAFTFWISVDHTFRSTCQMFSIQIFHSANSESTASLHFGTRLNFKFFTILLFFGTLFKTFIYVYSYSHLTENYLLDTFSFSTSVSLSICLRICIHFSTYTYIFRYARYILILLLFWMVLLLFFAGVSASVTAFVAFAASTALALMLLRYQKIRAYSMVYMWVFRT